MYVPPHFEETDAKHIKQLIEDFPLAVLIVDTDEGLVANHIPILLLNENVLIGHIALNNDLHLRALSDKEALVVFRGEDAYISPNWYPSKKTHHRHVPTWNYQVVHVYGKITFQHDSKSKRLVVGKLTQFHETKTNGADAWKMADAPRDFMETMLDNIVAFRIDISRVLGKSKLSQNRESQDYDHVADQLEANGKHKLSQAMRLKTVT